jgi:hypothetical protein
MAVYDLAAKASLLRALSGDGGLGAHERIKNAQISEIRLRVPKGIFPSRISIRAYKGTSVVTMTINMIRNTPQG